MLVAPLRPAPSREVDAAGDSVLDAVSLPHGPPVRDGDVYATRLPFDPGSRATGCASNGRTASYVEGLWSPSLVRVPENRTLKHTLIRSAIFRLTRRGSFSLRRGLEVVLVGSRAGHHPRLIDLVAPPKRRRRPSGSPSLQAVLRVCPSAYVSRRGLGQSRPCG